MSDQEDDNQNVRWFTEEELDAMQSESGFLFVNAWSLSSGTAIDTEGVSVFFELGVFGVAYDKDSNPVIDTEHGEQEVGVYRVVMTPDQIEKIVIQYQEEKDTLYTKNVLGGKPDE